MDGSGERENVLNHVKRGGIVREGEMSGAICPEEMPGFRYTIVCIERAVNS